MRQNENALLGPYPASDRRAVEAQLVVVMTNRVQTENRQLMKERSRALRRFDVHELLVTTDPIGPGDELTWGAFIGFFEVQVGGLVVVGDRLLLPPSERSEPGGRASQRSLGQVIGFEDHHMPNHLNLVVKAESLMTGAELDLRVADVVIFEPPR